MPLDVDKVLKASSASSSSDQRESVKVSRPLPASTLDLGNLLLVEGNSLPGGVASAASEAREEAVRAVARDNAQELLNSLFSVTPIRVDDVLVAPLPPPEFRLPRAKPLPKPRPPTKWERYAKEKGIQKKKRAKVVWDDAVRQWVPRYGYKKARAEEQKNWMMPYKGDAGDDAQDPFESAREQKRERVAKNELQRLRNIARARNVRVPGASGVTPITDKRVRAQTGGAEEAGRAAELARASTASLGKFQPGLKPALEKQAGKKPAGGEGRKRQFDPLVSKDGSERARGLKILEQMGAKRAKLDVSKAVGAQISTEERERSRAKREGGGKKKGGGGRGGKNRGMKGKGKGGGGGGTKRRGGAGKKPKKAGGGGRAGGGGGKEKKR